MNGRGNVHDDEILTAVCVVSKFCSYLFRVFVMTIEKDNENK